MASNFVSRGARRLSAVSVVAVVAVTAALLLGGGTRQGLMSDVVLQFICIPVLMFGLWQIAADGLPRHLRFPMIMLAAVVAIPILQLVPLPAWLADGLPYHSMLQDIRALAGQDRVFWPISVVPDATAQAALSLLVPVSVYLMCIRLNFEERRWLAVLLIAVGVGSAILGMVQISQGQSSGLRFFDITNTGEAVGFFANRNHLSALLYVTWLLAVVWFVDQIDRFVASTGQLHTEASVLLPVFALSCAVVLLLVAQLMARSRAGLILAGAAMLAAVLISARRQTAGVPGVARSSLRRIVGLGLAFTVVLSSQYALVRVLERLAYDPLQDARIVFAQRTYAAALAFLPTGSGVGTFVPVYAMFERPQDALLDTFANRAHNDVLEMFLENGVFGVVLLALFVAWLLHRLWTIWMHSMPGATPLDRRLTLASAVALILLLMHSLVDYPLRTAAMMALAAVFCSFLSLPASVPKPREGGNDGRTKRSREVMPAERETVAAGPGGAKAPAGAWGIEVDWPDAWKRPPNEKS